MEYKEYENTMLFRLCQRQNRLETERLIMEKLNLLIKQGADVNYIYKGTPCICEAARTNSLSIVKTLVKHGASVHSTDSYNCTPLYLASSHGFMDICEFLLKAGANINAKNSFNYTPLLSAIENLHKETSFFLIEKGADVNIRPPRSRLGEGTVYRSSSLLEATVEADPSLCLKLMEAGAKPRTFCKFASYWMLRNISRTYSLLFTLLKVGFRLNFDSFMVFNFHEESLTSLFESELSNFDEIISECTAHMTTPLSLQRSCRMTVRNALVDNSANKGHINDNIEKLCVPDAIKSFLKLENDV